jgi:hypothetical protein
VTRGKNRRVVYAADGFFADEVVPDLAGFVGQIIAIVVDMAREELGTLLFYLTPCGANKFRMCM